MRAVDATTLVNGDFVRLINKFYPPVQGILLQEHTGTIEKFCAMPYQATRVQVVLMLLYWDLTLDDFRKRYTQCDQDDQTPRLRVWLLEILIAGALSNGLMSSSTREDGVFALTWYVERIREAMVYKIMAYIKGPCSHVDLDTRESPEQ